MLLKMSINDKHTFLIDRFMQDHIVIRLTLIYYLFIRGNLLNLYSILYG